MVLILSCLNVYTHAYYVYQLKLHAGVYARDSTPQVCPCASFRVLSSREPRLADHLRELRLRREFTNRFDKVLVRVTVTSEDCSEKRDNGKRILIVHPVFGMSMFSFRMRKKGLTSSITDYLLC